jgi:hypothetical protein
MGLIAPAISLINYKTVQLGTLTHYRITSLSNYLIFKLIPKSPHPQINSLSHYHIITLSHYHIFKLITSLQHYRAVTRTDISIFGFFKYRTENKEWQKN